MKIRVRAEYIIDRLFYIEVDDNATEPEIYKKAHEAAMNRVQEEETLSRIAHSKES